MRQISPTRAPEIAVRPLIQAYSAPANRPLIQAWIWPRVKALTRGKNSSARTTPISIVQRASSPPRTAPGSLASRMRAHRNAVSQMATNETAFSARSLISAGDPNVASAFSGSRADGGY